MRYGYRHTTGVLVVIIIFLLGCAAVFAQTVDSTGNLVNPTTTTSGSTWTNGVYQNSLTCWQAGDPGYCGPNAIVRPGGDINFSYGTTDIYQQVNIAQALPYSGTGLLVRGYSFSYVAKVGNGWDDGRWDFLQSYVQLRGPSGDLKSVQVYTHNTTHDWSSFNLSRSFPDNRFTTQDLATARFGFVGRDNNYFAGPYGPEVNSVSFSLQYMRDPCLTNQLSSPQCPKFMETLNQMSAIPGMASTPIMPALLTVADTSEQFGSSTIIGLVTASSSNNSSQSTNGSAAANPAAQSFAVSLIRSNQQRESRLVNSSSAAAMAEAEAAAETAQREAESRAESSQATSVQATVETATAQTAAAQATASAFKAQTLATPAPVSTFKAQTVATQTVAEPVTAQTLTAQATVETAKTQTGSSSQAEVTMTMPAFAVSLPQTATPTTISAGNESNTQQSMESAVTVQATASAFKAQTVATPAPVSTFKAQTVATQTVAEPVTAQTLTAQATVETAKTQTGSSSQAEVTMTMPAFAVSLPQTATPTTISAGNESNTQQSMEFAVTVQAPMVTNTAVAVDIEQPQPAAVVTAAVRMVMPGTVRSQDIQEQTVENNSVVVAPAGVSPAVEPLAVDVGSLLLPSTAVTVQQAIATLTVMYTPPVNTEVGIVNNIPAVEIAVPVIQVASPLTTSVETAQSDNPATSPSNFTTNRTNPITEIVEQRQLASSAPAPVFAGPVVNTRVQDNELAGDVRIDGIARVPAGFDVYASLTLRDAAFYAPREIYRGQRNVDNVRALRNLAQEGRHQEMVDQQYRR